MKLRALLSLSALMMVGCGSMPWESTSNDRAAPSYAVFVPATGVTYNVPCTRCRGAFPQTTAVAYFDEALPDSDARPESVLAATAASIDQGARAGESAVPMQKVGIAAAPQYAESSEPLLKLDTEFASAKRLVPFSLGRASLGPLGKRAVAELVPLAREAERIHVSGHTDGSGDSAGNRKLAFSRASSVATAFVAAGVPSNKLATSFCTTCYIADNLSGVGRRLNRRVDVELVLPRSRIAKLPKPVYAIEPAAQVLAASSRLAM